MIDASNGNSEIRKIPAENKQKKEQLLKQHICWGIREKIKFYWQLAIFSLRSASPQFLWLCFKNSQKRSEINFINYTNKYLTQYFIFEESDSNTFEPLTQKVAEIFDMDAHLQIELN